MIELFQARLLRALPLLALVWSLAGCSLWQPEPLDPPVIQLRGLEPEAFGINSQVFRARLSLFNPNPVPLQVSGGKLELQLSGVRAATGRALAPFSVPAGETADVEIRVSMNLLRDGAALFQALSSGLATERLDYELTGHVDVRRRGPDRLPVRTSGSLSLSGGVPGRLIAPENPGN